MVNLVYRQKDEYWNVDVDKVVLATYTKDNKDKVGNNNSTYKITLNFVGGHTLVIPSKNQYEAETIVSFLEEIKQLHCNDIGFQQTYYNLNSSIVRINLYKSQMPKIYEMFNIDDSMQTVSSSDMEDAFFEAFINTIQEQIDDIRPMRIIRGIIKEEKEGDNFYFFSSFSSRLRDEKIYKQNNMDNGDLYYKKYSIWEEFDKMFQTKIKSKTFIKAVNNHYNKRIDSREGQNAYDINNNSNIIKNIKNGYQSVTNNNFKKRRSNSYNG